MLHLTGAWVQGNVLTMYDMEIEDENPLQEPTDPYYRIQLPSFGLPEADPSWRAHSACRDSSLDFFNGQASNVARCKVVCNQCPVESNCLEYALTYGEEFGIFGGMTADERRPLMKARRG